jgi:hypothetical protein
VNIQNASSATETLVPAAKIDASNAVLAQHGSAHDARLDSDIEISLLKSLDGMLGEDAGDGDELGMPGAIQRSICLIHATTNDFAVSDKNTADWSFIALQCQFGLS